MIHSIPWFFLTDLSHQILFYFGGIVAMLILLWEKWRGKPVSWTWVCGFFGFCLFISAYQSFVDEHHNSEQLIREKSDIAGQMEFWKAQSYTKEATLRSRDLLLGQNFQALTQSQITANDTQKSLTGLSSKILDLSRPFPRISNQSLLLTTAPNSPNSGIVIAQTNVRRGAFSGKLVCQQPFSVIKIALLEGRILQIPNYTPSQGQTSLDISFSGAAWEPQEPIVAILVGDNLEIHACEIK